MRGPKSVRWILAFYAIIGQVVSTLPANDHRPMLLRADHHKPDAFMSSQAGKHTRKEGLDASMVARRFGRDRKE